MLYWFFYLLLMLIFVYCSIYTTLLLNISILLLLLGLTCVVSVSSFLHYHPHKLCLRQFYKTHKNNHYIFSEDVCSAHSKSFCTPQAPRIIFNNANTPKTIHTFLTAVKVIRSRSDFHGNAWLTPCSWPQSPIQPVPYRRSTFYVVQ